MSIRSLRDLNADGNNEKQSSFAGGEKSGLAVEHPNDKSSTRGDFLNSVVSGNAPDGSRKVTVYSNGFCIDDGEFRPSGDPENDTFLKELKSGYAPRELRTGDAEVYVILDDKRSETYKESKDTSARKLFTGEGQTCGSPTTSSTGGEVDLSKGKITLNNNEPTTTLLIRFYNGTSNHVVFNQSHTLNDVHGYLREVAPVNGQYVLIEGFPPKEITADPSQTLKQAGLLNAAITQKLK